MSALVNQLSTKRLFTTICVAAVLGFLITREMSNWRHFDWSVFYANARYVSISRTLAAVAITYAGFLLRAIRWRILLRPVKEVPAARLLGPTLIGFTGLALLGRSSEFIRPYLIARKEHLSISSQMAVLTLERIFDMTAALMLIVTAILSSSELRGLPYLAQLGRGALVLTSLVAIASMVVFLLAIHGERLGVALQRILSPLSTRLAHGASEMAKAFGADLNLIRDAKSLAQIIVLSVAIWFSLALASLETIHAFEGLQRISLAGAFVLLGFSLMGSLAPLPGGGTQQLLVLAALVDVFGVSTELAVSCSILGWLAIFIAPVPAGLILLRHEQLSLSSLSRTSRQPEAV
jgi:uncharacterized protein (TIRG00374 family)